MATPAADRAVLDTNVLLTATDEGRPGHTHALTALNSWPAAGVVLYTSGQILREYLVVATRPVSGNGLGLDREHAIGNVRALRARLQTLAEDLRVSDRLVDLLDDVRCTGSQIHDANIVATMLVHGIETLVTANVTDFRRFDRHISLVDLSDVN